MAALRQMRQRSNLIANAMCGIYNKAAFRDVLYNATGATKMLAKRPILLVVAVLACGLSLLENTAIAQLKAFPEAEGFGALVSGGRGGSIYHVTNLNDSGTGSFRDAISASNRIVVFDICGVINSDPANPLAFSNNITVAGQTAPGGGITIYGNYVSLSSRNNIIMRDIRIRPGVNTASDKKGLNITTGHDMIIDHCSIEWARYDNVGMTSNSYNITMQNCMIAEPIQSQYSNCLVDSSRTITLSRNLWIDAKTRNPKTKGDLQYINNVVYNWGVTEALSGGHSSADWYEDIINNYFIKGPSSSTTIAGEFSSTDMVYQTGNLKDTDRNGTLNGTAMSTSDFSTPTFTSTAYNNPAIAVTTDSATSAYYKVVAGAGATPQNRDPVDTRLVNQVLSLGTSGAVITDESVVGGQPSMTVVTRPAGFDTDSDGMPDTWETAHGLNPSLASDRNLLNPLGYTVVEQYINELGGNHSTPTWQGTSANWATPSFWSTAALPTNDDNAYINGNGSGNDVVVLVTGAAATCFSLHIGGGSGSANGEKVTVLSGTLPVVDTIYVGDQDAGTLEITGGTVQAWNVQLGNTVNGTTYTGNLLLSGGTLKTYEVVLGGGTPGSWTTGGTCTWSGGTVQAIGALKFAVPATIGTGGAIINTNGFNGTVSGVLSGIGGLTKTGSGTLTISASNTYGGDTKISGGSITISNARALQNSTLDYNSYGGAFSFGTLTSAFLGGLKGNQDLVLTNASSVGVQLQVGGNGQSTSYSGDLSGAGSLTKIGTGALILAGANAYAGSTTISAGTLELAATGQIDPASAISTSTSGAVLQVDSGNHTLGNISGIGTTLLSAEANLTAASVVQGTITLGTGATLTISAIAGGPNAGPLSVAVPEPSSIVLLIVAAATLCYWGKRS
jgi:autotransporter-associated beta strand protein